MPGKEIILILLILLLLIIINMQKVKVEGKDKSCKQDKENQFIVGEIFVYVHHDFIEVCWIKCNRTIMFSKEEFSEIVKQIICKN
jgi:hypothetical protein